MTDMDPASIVGNARECTLQHFQSVARKVYVTDVETPYPQGKLIVSRTNVEGVITHCNQSFVDMSGYEEHELVGQPHCILRHPDMPAAAFRDLWETVQAGRQWHGYVKNLRKDGAYYWVYATVVPNVRDGQIVGYTSVRREPARNRIAEAEALYRSMS
ncbi:MAG TPA: PAS domain-containing protein [Rhodocyclaceae bacterium]|nr:PAS domain-containing protein [Rhodocyclaceae bacterium]